VVDPVLDKIYVGTTTGRIQQHNLTNGTLDGFLLVTAGERVGDPSLDQGLGIPNQIDRATVGSTGASGTMARYCVPFTFGTTEPSYTSQSLPPETAGGGCVQGPTSNSCQDQRYAENGSFPVNYTCSVPSCDATGSRACFVKAQHLIACTNAALPCETAPRCEDGICVGRPTSNCTCTVALPTGAACVDARTLQPGSCCQQDLCVNTGNDVANCGYCGVRCTGPTPVCVNGVCCPTPAGC
jgi:hypothetical protein